MPRKLKVNLLRYGLLLFIVLAWLYANGPGEISRLLVPSLSEVLETFWEFVTTSASWDAVRQTVFEMLVAFVLAVVLGLGFGLWAGRTDFRARVFEPLLMWGYLVPTVLFFPLLLLWFGLGLWSKVIYAAAAAFFPIAYNTLRGVRSVSPNVIRTARAFGASSAQLDRVIKIGAASPMILSGIRIGVSLVMIAVIFSEMLGSYAGLGHELGRAYQTLDSTRTFAIIIFIMIMASVVQGVANRTLGQRKVG